VDIGKELTPSEKDAMMFNSQPDLLDPVDKRKMPRVDSGSTLSDTSTERGTWGKKLEFMLTCVSYAVGLGNIWRFPYLCYKNGGGAFLIPYFTMMFVCGMPIFFMELAFGQFASLGPIAIWKVCPMFKGLGHSMVMVSLYISIYFAVILSYVVFYFFSSFTMDLPWESCNNLWNSPNCRARVYSVASAITYSNNSDIANINLTSSQTNVTLSNVTETKHVSPSEDYFFNYVLHTTSGIHDLGSINWTLLASLALVWILAGAALIRGIQSLGKVSYVTAIFPYFCLTALLINAVQLDGAKEGILFYLTPDFSKLSDPGVWSDAAIQIFYSMGPCMGSLIMMGSFNKFDNNCRRDTVFVCLINCMTSFYGGFAIFAVLGFMAKTSGVPINKVAQSGPGLAFVAYPEGLAQMPAAPAWCILFFTMMFIVGMGTMLGMFESVLTAIEDEYPICRRKRTLFRISACVAAFVLGIPQVTEGGFYIMNLMDQNVGGFNLLVIGLLEIFIVMYIYGYDRFLEDISMMLGRRPSFTGECTPTGVYRGLQLMSEGYWRFCWQFMSLATLASILVFLFVRYSPPTCGLYTYPDWAVTMGWLMATSTVVSIPLVAIKVLIEKISTVGKAPVVPASFWRRAQAVGAALIHPEEDWGPASKADRKGAYLR